MKTMIQLSGRARLRCAVALGFLWAGATASAQTFTTLKSFGVSTNLSGTEPKSELVEGPDGTLYGAAASGGVNGQGTVFKVRPDGTDLTVLKHFSGTDGGSPLAGLKLSGGTLYGTTWSGGAANAGTAFKVNTDGTGFTVLKHFTGSDASNPGAGLTLSGNSLYGTTTRGGNSNFGTVFKLNTDGTGFTVLKHFTGGDGRISLAALTLSGSTLYGTTQYGGSADLGTMFKIDLSNTPDFSLDIQSLGNAVVLKWSNPALTLQASPDLAAGFATIPGALSPYTDAITGPQRFFRLIGN